MIKSISLRNYSKRLTQSIMTAFNGTPNPATAPTNTSRRATTKKRFKRGKYEKREEKSKKEKKKER